MRGLWEYGKRFPWRTCWEPVSLDEVGEYGQYVVAVSGGADSTAALLWVLERVPRERVQAVHYVTGVEWPETLAYLEYIQDALDVEIKMMSNGVNFLEMLYRFGRWPTARGRWCTRILKEEVYTPYVWSLDDPVMVVGSRRHESKPRRRLPFFTTKVRHGATKRNVPTLYPLITWTRKQVRAYIEGRGLVVNPVYQYVSRCSCWCCILGSYGNVVQFCRLHPELAEPFAEFERESGFTWRKRGGSIEGALEEARTI